MKTCFRCKQSKPLDAFRPQSKRRSGYSSWCRQCYSEYRKAWDEAHPEAAKQHRLKSSRKWRASHPAEARASTKKATAKYRVNNPDGYRGKVRRHGERRKLLYPEKYAAKQAVNIAIHSGKLIRQACEVCGDPKTHGHHDDYSKPLTVRWLCAKHHVEHHRNSR